MSRRVRRTAWGRVIGGVAIAAVGCALALPGSIAAATTPHLGSRTSQPAAGVPKDFKANSVTWASPQQGWVLGTGKCSPKPCSDVIGTTDGAQTWQLVGSLPVGLAVQGEPKPLGVTEIRFATPKVGWAFAPLLLTTSDGGQTWTRVALPGGAKQVLSLATNSAGAYAVLSPCKWMDGPCKQPMSFWRIAAGSGSWTQIDVDLPVGFAANVTVFDKTVYVVDPQLQFGGDDKFYASTDGRHFSARTSPCDHAQNIELVQAVATSATNVDMLCNGDPGFSKSVKTVYRSKDTGTTDTYAGMAGFEGIQSQLAASPSDHLAIASSSSGSFMYVNNSHKKTWTMTEGIGDGGRGWNDIVYTTNKDAWVVYSPAAFFDGVGQLWVTHDSGVTWDVAPF